MKPEMVRDGFLRSGGDIVLWREGGVARANVPHAIVRHSPGGFEWGYGGSGPADLALNILYAVTEDLDFAERWYQKFKWEFIACMPYAGGTIPRQDIERWIREVQQEHPGEQEC